MARRRTRPSPWQERTKIERPYATTPAAELWTRLPQERDRARYASSSPGAPIPGAEGSRERTEAVYPGCAVNETGVKLVHDFNEGSREMSELLGDKGANLAEMTRVVGADRVPGGFNDHDGGLRRLRGRHAPDGLWEQVEQPRGRIVDSCIPHGTSISSTSPSALSCADCRGELDLPTAVGLATPVRKRGAGDLQVRRGRTETHLLCVSAQLLGRYSLRPAA